MTVKRHSYQTLEGARCRWSVVRAYNNRTFSAVFFVLKDRREVSDRTYIGND
jgi:hypothetical protein